MKKISSHQKQAGGGGGLQGTEGLLNMAQKMADGWIRGRRLIGETAPVYSSPSLWLRGHCNSLYSCDPGMHLASS